MKYFGILIICLWMSGTTYGQKFIYESEQFNELSKDHKVLAILPFYAHLELIDQKDLNPSQLSKLEQREGYAVQEALESYFLKKKKRKKFAVNFQSISVTNALLEKHNINYNNLNIYTSKQLSKILKVDGIISGNLNLDVLLSEGVTPSFNVLDYFLGKSNFGRIAIKISDAQSNKLIWKYEKKIEKKSYKNTEDLIERMMKKGSRKFPYDREKRKDRKNK